MPLKREAASYEACTHLNKLKEKDSVLRTSEFEDEKVISDSFNEPDKKKRVGGYFMVELAYVVNNFER